MSENVNIIDSLDKVIEKAYDVMGKKLTTKQRKALKPETYCGPQKSFPVNDCAHYTAALRLLNRSKFSSSTKAKIKRCIINKGIKLGCKGAKEKKSEKSSYLTVNMQKLYDSDEFKSTKELVEESIKIPGKNMEEKE